MSKNRLFQGWQTRKTNGLAVYAVFLLFWAGVIPAAHAYLDPGTGSFVIQTLLAALFGGLFVLKSYWVRIKSWFYGKPEEAEKTLSAKETDVVKAESKEDVSSNLDE